MLQSRRTRVEQTHGLLQQPHRDPGLGSVSERPQSGSGGDAEEEANA